MRDRAFEHPQTVTPAKLLQAHAAARALLLRAGWTDIPAASEVATQLRRLGVECRADDLYEPCAHAQLPLSDRPVERETRARRKY